MNAQSVVGEFVLCNCFDSLIDDIIDYQGYNGAPRVIDSQEEFDDLVKQDHFLGERTLRADSVDVLDSYCDQLLCKNGEDYFYINCGVGGAQYGQGMYCVADYSKGKIEFSEFQHEIKHYGEIDGAKQSRTLWFTILSCIFNRIFLEILFFISFCA